MDQVFLSISDMSALGIYLQKVWCCLTFYDEGGPYHIKTSPMICSANQWTSFYMTATSAIKELGNRCPK